MVAENDAELFQPPWLRSVVTSLAIEYMAWSFFGDLWSARTSYVPDHWICANERPVLGGRATVCFLIWA